VPLPGPTRPHERLEVLDVLRGLALMGILMMNARAFLMPERAYLNPAAWGGLDGANLVAWFATSLLASEKFLSLFALLYGVGIALMAERAEARGDDAWVRHLRRTGAVLVAGLAHAYLLWHGDILVAYALTALAVYPARRLTAGWRAGLALAAYATGWGVHFYLSPQWLATPGLEAWWRPEPMVMAEEIAFRMGPLAQQWSWNAGEAFYAQTTLFVQSTFWLAGAFMLAGMALVRAGWPGGSGRPAPPRAGWLAAALLGPGILLEAAGLLLWRESGFAYATYLYGYSALHAVATPLLTLGYAAGAGWLCRTQALRWLRAGLAAAGRLALTNYLVQSLAGVLLVNALGLFALFERTEQLGLALVFFTVQAGASWAYLRVFRMGPLEWLLRVATYGWRARSGRRGMPA